MTNRYRHSGWSGFTLSRYGSHMEDILLIDDDVELCQMLTEYLGRYEFRVHAVHRGEAGLEAVRHRAWPMVLLDVMLPGMDGFEVLRQIRGFFHGNVMLLTARGEDVDRIVGLEIGADDYLPKPFNPRELLARIRAVRRRNSAVLQGDSKGTVLTVDELVLDRAARIVTQAGRPLDLTDIEFTLLEVLMRTPGKIVERETLAEEVLGRRFHPFDRSLDMHVSRLRRKIGGDTGGDELVKTVRGAGYQLALRRTAGGGGS
jgi:DNA-binding response OmpR family regulator